MWGKIDELRILRYHIAMAKQFKDIEREEKDNTKETVSPTSVIAQKPRKTFADARFERASRGVSEVGVAGASPREDETQRKIAELREDILRQSAQSAETTESGKARIPAETRKAGRLSTLHTPETDAITTAMEREAQKRFTDDELYEAVRQVVREKQIPDELKMAVALELARDAANEDANRRGRLRELVAKDTGYRFQLNVIMDALANAMGKELVERIEIDKSRREALKNGGIFGRLARAIKGDNALRTQLEKKFAGIAAEVKALEEIKADLERKVKLLEDEERKEREKTRKAQEDALAKLATETDKIIALASQERDEARKAKDQAIEDATTDATAIIDKAKASARELIVNAKTESDLIIREMDLKKKEIDRLTARAEELKRTEQELSESHEGATAELAKLRKTKEMIEAELKGPDKITPENVRYFEAGPKAEGILKRIKSIMADPY